MFLIELSLQPLPLPGTWGLGGGFQSSHHLIGSLGYSPHPDAVWALTKSHFLNINSGMVETGLLCLTLLSLRKFKGFWKFCARTKTESILYYTALTNVDNGECFENNQFSPP